MTVKLQIHDSKNIQDVIAVVQFIYAKTKKKYLQNQYIQMFENIKENVSKSQVHTYFIKTKAVMTS